MGRLKHEAIANGSQFRTEPLKTESDVEEIVLDSPGTNQRDRMVAGGGPQVWSSSVCQAVSQSQFTGRRKVMRLEPPALER